jgi:two-component system, OmpR family, response regulator
MFGGPDSVEMPVKEPLQDVMGERPARILLVDSDVDASNTLAQYLRRRDFEVFQDAVGRIAPSQIAEMHLSLIVLDVALPALDGFELCREIRAAGLTIPVMILTARDDEFDQVLGLELGADDYVSKAIPHRVLFARIKALLRRTGQEEFALPSPPQMPLPARRSPPVITFQYGQRSDSLGLNEGGVGAVNSAAASGLEFGRLHINRVAREVTLSGQVIDISAAEFDLLWLLATNAGRVLPRHEILKALRGLDYDGVDRSIDSRVSRLRRKLSDALGPASHIKTVRPQGYLFTPTAW